MARMDTITALIDAGMGHDVQRVRTLACQIMAQERANGHTIAADAIARALGTGGTDEREIPTTGGRGGSPLAYNAQPRHALADLWIDPEVVADLEDLVSEHTTHAQAIREAGLEPRHRLLFAGPPGNGKTATAEALAAAMDLPLWVARYDSLIGSYLGETATHMTKLLQSASEAPCVLLFDEFDAVGKERGDAHEVGEMKRLVASLVMQMDRLPSHTVVICTTNHQELLDRALWRRFQVCIGFPAPMKHQIPAWFKIYASTTIPNDIADWMADLGASFAELRDVCSDAARRVALGREGCVADAIARVCFRWCARVRAETA